MKRQSALYIVATPIGNLADITFRAVQVLKEVDLIAAEDTRHSAKLLQHYQIDTPLVSYHEHGGQLQEERLLARLRNDESVALISDAGTPLICDPGYRVVNSARREGVTVVPVPGACAFVAALSASGLPSDRLAFEGFTPAKTHARCQLFESLVKDRRTLVFYESPHRIEASLQDMCTSFGAQRQALMAREISKSFETFLVGTLAEILQQVEQDSNQRKGEIVILVEGDRAKAAEHSVSDQAQETMRVLMQELPLKQAAALAAKLCDEKKNKLYQWALQEKAQDQ